MLNWRIRYQRMVSENPELSDPALSVLEIGGGPGGLGELLGRNVTSLVGRPAGRACTWVTPVAGSLLSLPFADRAFDHVVCVDGLKFVAPGARAQCVAELARVARRKVILSMPCGAMAIQGDLELAAASRRMGQETPDWLQENITRQLPGVAEMMKLISSTGSFFEIQSNETLLQHYSGLLLDICFPLASQMASAEQRKTRQQIMPATGWEMYYSYLFTLLRAEPDEAVVQTQAARREGPPLSRTAEVRSDSQIKLYAVYHRRLPLAPATDVAPVYVGEAASLAHADERTATLLDDSRWSELAGVREIWRNGPRSDFVGFCHYRRMFDFSQRKLDPRATQLDYERFQARAHITASQHAMAHFENNADTLVVAPPLRLQGSVWDQYAAAHNINDLCLIANLVRRRHPHLVEPLAQTFSAHELYANNLFVTCWDHFEELCSLWFDVFGAFENSVPARTEDRYQRRDIGFLSERLFDAWVRYRAAQGTRLVEVPILEIEYPALDITAWSRAPTAVNHATYGAYS